MVCHFRYLSSLLKVIMQATLKKLRYFENFSAYIPNNATSNYNEHLNELNQRNFYKPHGRLHYSASLILYALHLLAYKPYIYVIRHYKRAGYYLKNFKCCLCHC